MFCYLIILIVWHKNIWAATWQNQQSGCAPSEDKTNKMSVRPAKTQISLGIRPVCSESSLSAWRKLGSLATHWAHSEDADQTGRMPRLIDLSLCWAHTHFVGFVMSWLILVWNDRIYWNWRTINKDIEMSRLMTKPTKGLRAQRRLRSAWAQSDQRLRCALNG